MAKSFRIKASTCRGFKLDVAGGFAGTYHQPRNQVKV